MSELASQPADPLAEALRGRDCLTLADYSADEIIYLLDLAARLKEYRRQGIATPWLAGKSLGMIFQKPSTRTRVSFEVGMYQLGGQALFLSGQDLQLSRGEPIADTAQVLSRFVNGLIIRTHAHQEAEELARYASVPVINALTDKYHPCQALADMLTLREKHGRLAGLRLAYLGDGNNVAHSLMIASALLGMTIAVASPRQLQPSAEVVDLVGRLANRHGGRLLITEDPREAVQGADAVYTDVWTSMGFEEERQERLRVLAPYRVTEDLCREASPDYLFLHCLPAHRDEEVEPAVMDGPHSVVFDQAENRMHVQKALLALLMA